MKVIQINSVCGVGSTGRIVVDLYKKVLQHGGECTIAFGRGSAPDGINSYKICGKLSFYMHVILSRLFDRQGLYSSIATKKLIKKIIKEDPDIINLHNLHGYYLNYKILFNFLKKYNVPVVWTFHDCWSFTGHCAHFDFLGCDKWKSQCSKCKQKKIYPASIIFDNSKRNFELKKSLYSAMKNITVITPSSWLAGLCKESFFADAEVVVVNNGIDLNSFKPTESDFRKKYNLENKFIILGMANGICNLDAIDRKGMHYFKKLAEKTDDNTVIVLVGFNDENVELPDRMMGIKRTESIEELAKIYSSADVFVNPTLEDTFPTVNLEALACGTPVVTFKTGGSPESIDETCGIVVEKYDVDGLYDAVLKIKEGKYTAEACLKRAKLYDKDLRFEEYYKIYERLLESKVKESWK